ncbi:MAG TPA: UDP-N-acetylmuramyl peptide synthase [Ruminococcaceae bacterium]|nr:UDP-N-acetylmuramyl peptide synthase [Oscillospiraceae bacterium]
MTVILYIAAGISLFSMLLCLPRQIHMLQQASYYNLRYMAWLRGNWSRGATLAAMTALLQILLCFLGPMSHIPLLCLCVISGVIRAYLAFKRLNTAIKKLVYTARVKRMIVSAALIAAALEAVMIIFIKDDTSAALFTAGCVLLCVLVPAVLIFVNILNRPLELFIAYMYVLAAKKILKRHTGMKIIGITGSYGKTSTKFFLGRMLSEKYNTLVTPESYNTLMGVVRTVREYLKSGTQVFVVEMGARKPRDIKRIARLTHPEMGIITSVGPQHLDTFHTVERIIKTKFELSDEVMKNGGVMYLNGDNEYIRENAPENNTVFFGTGGGCGCTAEDIRYSRDGSQFTIKSGDIEIPVSTRLLGTHNVLNILAAASVALDLGLSPDELKYAVLSLAPVSHRLEMKPFLNGSVLIDDAFNANPSGSLEAVRVLGSFEGMRKIIVTPGLVELADKEYEHNYNLGLAAGKTCDVVILVGQQRAVPMTDAIKTLPFDTENLHVVDSFKQAMEILEKITDQNTAVLFENDLPDNYLK